MNSNHRYTMQLEVPYYECDVNDRMRLSFVLKHVQQIGTEQLDRMGLPYHLLFAEGQCFVLAKMGLKVHRMPVSGQKITVYSSPQGTAAAQFLREVTIAGENGEKLVEVQTIWLLIDPASRKILRPDQFRHTLPVIPQGERMAEDYAAGRIKPTGEVIWQGEHPVRYSHIDINHHMNNTVYADLVTDALPYEEISTREVDRFLIKYQSEAVVGETISVTTRRGEDGFYYVEGRKESGRCFEAKISLKPSAV